MNFPRRALILALGVIGGALILAAPYLLESFYLRVLGEVLIFGLFATSINLLVGFGGLPTLGHAGIFGVSAYAVGYFLVRSGAPWALWQALWFAVLAAMAVTVIFGLMAVRTSGIYFLMITLAQGMIIWGLAFRWASVTNAENGIRGIDRPDVIGSYPSFYYLVLAVSVLALLGVHRLSSSSFGLSLKGLRERESRMAALGYHIPLHKFLGFLMAGFLGAIAGILWVFHNEFVSPSTVEFATSAEGLLMVILGGTGTLYGPMLGALIVTFTRHQISLYTDRWLMILGAIYVVTILLAPDGLVSGLGRLARRMRGQPPGDGVVPELPGLPMPGEPIRAGRESSEFSAPTK
ncbi:MAG: branched-chain amino acid ABC transporter permease [Acidimicrobiia bacterium]